MKRHVYTTSAPRLRAASFATSSPHSTSDAGTFATVPSTRSHCVPLALVVLALASTPAVAQRAIGGGAIVLDDGSGHKIVVSPPAGLTQSSYTWSVPTPPATPTPSGFVGAGSATGQTLSWTGSQWSANSLLTNNGSSVGLGASLLPAGDNTYNIGDATHRINTLYVSNIVGVSLGGGGGSGTNYWDRSGTTVSPLTAGDNIATSGQLRLIGANGTTNIAAGNQSGAAVSYVLPTAQGASNTLLRNDGSGNLSWYSPVLFARKSASQTFTSLADDSHISFSVGANETYTIDGFLIVTDVNAAGISCKVGFAVPSGSTLKFGAMSTASNQTQDVNASGLVVSNIPLYSNLGTEQSMIHVSGLLMTGSTAGTFKLQVASSSNSNGVQVQANSYLQLTRVQ